MIITDFLVIGAFVVLLPAIIVGILNEEKLIAWEDRMLSKIRRVLEK